VATAASAVQASAKRGAIRCRPATHLHISGNPTYDFYLSAGEGFFLSASLAAGPATAARGFHQPEVHTHTVETKLIDHEGHEVARRRSFPWPQRLRLDCEL